MSLPCHDDGVHLLVQSNKIASKQTSQLESMHKDPLHTFSFWAWFSWSQNRHRHRNGSWVPPFCSFSFSTRPCRPPRHHHLSRAACTTPSSVAGVAWRPPCWHLVPRRPHCHFAPRRSTNAQQFVNRCLHSGAIGRWKTIATHDSLQK